MSLIQATILGIVQGITELLPISSSAHLIIIPKFAGWVEHDVIFDIFLHVGSFLALLFFFGRKINKIIKSTIAVKTKFSQSVGMKYLIILIPVALLGLLVGQGTQNPKYIAISLITIGFFMIYISKYNILPKNKTYADLSMVDAMIIGLLQTLSLFPGVSRSGITISTAMALGYKKKDATEISFVAAVFLLCGITIVSLASLRSNYIWGNLPVILTGFISSFLVSLLTLHILFKKINKIPFGIFGVYRILLGIVLLVIFS